METTAGEPTPELLAARIIEVMRRGVTLEDGSAPFTATVSVGIAIGARANAAGLLRDADLALYTAKSSGKDRAAVFHAGMPSVAESRTQLELDLEEATNGPARGVL